MTLASSSFRNVLTKNLYLIVCSAKEREITIEIAIQWPKIKHKEKYSRF
jgi:hypothetical protein